MFDGRNIELTIIHTHEIKHFTLRLRRRLLLAQNANTSFGEQVRDGFLRIHDHFVVAETAEHAVTSTKASENLYDLLLRCWVPTEIV